MSKQQTLVYNQPLPLLNPRDKFVIPHHPDFDVLKTQIVWSPNQKKSRVDLQLCAVLYDHEGLVIGYIYFNKPNYLEGVGLFEQQPDKNHQQIQFSLSKLPTHCKMVFLFVCCYPGDELSNLEHFHCSIDTVAIQQCLYDVDESNIPHNNHSNSIVLCRFLRKESGERQWELMSIFAKCDPGYRFQDVVLEYIGDSFPIQLKQNTVQLKKKWKYQLQLQHFQQQAQQQAQQQQQQYLIPIFTFPVTKESFVPTQHLHTQQPYFLQWGCDWQLQPQEDVIKFPLEVQTILYGHHGCRYDVVDRTHRMSRDHSVMMHETNDSLCLMKLDLQQVSPHVKCMIVVMVAPQSGFSKLVHPYLRMFQQVQQKEVEWYRSGNLMDYVDYRISMNIAFKLTRTNSNTEWQFQGIHQSSVATSAFHQALEQELQPWIDVEPIPPCIDLLQQSGGLELNHDAVVLDLNCTNHSAPQFILESVTVAQFNEHGKEVLHCKTFTNNRLMNLKIQQSHCSRPRDVTLDLNEWTLHDIHTVLVLASVIVDANNVINANSVISTSGIPNPNLQVYLCDKDQKNQICSFSMDYMAKSPSSPLLHTYCMLSLKRNTNTNRWRVEWNGTKIAPSDRVDSCQGNVSALKFVRCIRHLLDKELLYQQSHQVFQGETCHIKPYDAKDIVMGFGMEQSLLESIQHFKPNRCKVSIELYDSFTTLQQVLDHHNQSVDGMQYYSHDQLMMQTANDEVQIAMNRVAFSHVKYRVIKMEVKSRKWIQQNDQFYCRVCDSSNGREICRILIPASLFLKGYSTTTNNTTTSTITRRPTIRNNNNKTMQHPVASRASLSKIPVNTTTGGANVVEEEEEEDVDSENQISVLCCIVQQSVDGWILKAIGKVTDALNEMDPAPKKLYMELIGGRNLVSGIGQQQQQLLDFSVKLKMNEKKKRLLKSKQRAKSKVQQKSTNNPTWNEKFEFNIYHPDDCLEFKLVVEDGKKFYLEGISNIFVKDALAFEGQVKELELRLLDKSGFVVQQEQGQTSQQQLPVLTVKFWKE